MVPRAPGPRRRPRSGVVPLLVSAAALALVTGCTRADESATAPIASTATTSGAVVTIAAPPTIAPPATTTPATTTPATTTPATTAPATTLPATAAPTPAAPSRSSGSSGSTPYVVPVADVAAAGWADEHHDYPATDVFVGCGADIVSPVDGTLLEVRRENRYDPGVDNPATRGGRSVSILGDDGVRYYLAHLDTIDEQLAPGVRVAAGDHLATMGSTGRASACHVHVAISPPCPGPEWSVRRGVVWPYPYLDAWRDGKQRSPADEVAAWSAAHPDACAEAMADPAAADA